MGRIRTIKPEFFRHEGLYDLELDTGLPMRLAFAGLWTTCDREGRFKWRPRTLKAEVLPFDGVDFSRVLDALATRGFLVRYAINGEEYGCVPSWNRHQIINNREQASAIPAPPENLSVQTLDACPTREAREDHAGQGEGKGKEGKGKEGAPLERATKRATPFLDGFELDAEMIAFANEYGVKPVEEFARFRDHHKAKGSAFKDWKAAWRTWVRNAVEFRKTKHAPQPIPQRRSEARREENARPFLEPLPPLPCN